MPMAYAYGYILWNPIPMVIPNGMTMDVPMGFSPYPWNACLKNDLWVHHQLNGRFIHSCYDKIECTRVGTPQGGNRIWMLLSSQSKN